MNWLSVSDVVRKLGARPRDITDLFYRRVLGDGACPVIGKRRVIPADYVPAIREAQSKRGKLSEVAAN